MPKSGASLRPFLKGWQAVMMKRMERAALAAMMIGALAAGASAFEQPLFPLDAAQLKALDAYAGERGHKAFAASPQGGQASAAGFLSATVAAREALKACDALGPGCIVIDLDGQPVPLALQFAQGSRASANEMEKPLPLRDLDLGADAVAALDGYRDKAPSKAFAISLKGPWARAWEAKSPEEAEKEALGTCGKNERAASAPCFVLMKGDSRIAGETLLANPDLSVVPAK